MQCFGKHSQLQLCDAGSCFGVHFFNENSFVAQFHFSWLRLFLLLTLGGFLFWSLNDCEAYFFSFRSGLFLVDSILTCINVHLRRKFIHILPI